MRQFVERSVCLLVVFHEDVVANLDVAPAVAGGRTFGIVLRAVVAGDEKGFRIRAAWARYANGSPEVIFAAQAENPLRGISKALPNFIARFVGRRIFIATKNGYCQAVLVKAEFLGNELVCPCDGFFFEIVAKAPVAEHFEKSAVPVVADLIDVLGAHAFLRIDEALAQRMWCAHQVWHKWVHAGCREKHRRVVFWLQRCGGNLGVLASLVKIQIFFADRCCRHGAFHGVKPLQIVREIPDVPG